METDEEFDRRIKTAISTRLEATGATRADLARSAGISRSTLDRSLDKDRAFKTAEIYLIATHVLHVKPSVIINEADVAA